MKLFIFYFKKLLFFVFVLLFFVSCGEKKGSVQLQEKYLSKYDVKGIARLSGETDHSGIAVFVGGTQIVAYTNEDGEFLIKGLDKGTYQLYAQKSGYNQIRFKKLFLNTKDKIIDAGIVILEPSEIAKGKKSSLSGKISLLDATDFSNIPVIIENTDYSALTNKDGSFLIKEIEPGVYTIAIKKDNYKPFSDTIEIKKDETLRLTQITLEPIMTEGIGIIKKASGISESEGRTIAGYVILKKLDGSNIYDFTGVRVKIEEINYVIRPDSNGNFSFSYLNSGKYRLSAELEGYKLSEIIGVDVTESDVKNITLSLQEKEPEQKFGSIKGKVVLESKENSAGAQVTIPGTNFLATTSSDSTFKFKDIPYGSYTLLAKIEGYNTLESEKFNIDRSEEIDIGELYLEKTIDYPKVLYTDPSDNASIQVKRNVPVFVKFSKRMDTNSVKSALLIDPEVAYIAFMGKESKDSDYDLLQIVLKGNDLQKGLRFNKTYNIKIGSTAKDFEGHNLQDNYAFSLKTGKPSIIETTPSNGAKAFYFKANEPVRILFNAPMNHTSVRNSIRFTPELEYVPSVDILDSVGDGWTEARINYTWKPDTKYTVTIDKKAVTINKETLSNTPYNLTFTTGRPVSFDEIQNRMKRF